VLQAYRAINSQIYRTDRHGAIEIHSSAAGLKINSYRQDNFKYWR